MKNFLLLLIGCLFSLASFAQNALNFDGVNDDVLVPDNATLDMGTSDFTIEAWIKTSSTSADQQIVSKRGSGLGNGYVFRVNSTTGFVSPISLDGNTTSGAVSTTNVADGNWHHVAGTYDRSGNITVYVDGVAEGTDDMTSEPGDLSNALALGIGTRPSGNSQQFTGTIDEVRIWNVLRSGAEILANMNTELDCATANLVACYHFNQGVAGGANGGVTTLTDGTANNNDGTLTNFALTGATSNWVAGATALPVEMVSFDARLLGTSILLTWQTATETNNRGWEIEHSTNAKDWKWVGFSGGRGESFELQSYTYTHPRPTPGANYYRLKQIDYDGKSEYSDVVSVQFEAGSGQVTIFPNPVRADELTLYLPDPEASGDEKAIIRLYDQTGRLMIQQTTSSQQETLNVSQLAAGIYFVEVTVGGTVFREKVVVE